MIVKEELLINNKRFIKQYSDKNFYIERDNIQYSEAIDPIDFIRKYEETDIPIETDENILEG